jgi:hypothetical protein
LAKKKSSEKKGMKKPVLSFSTGMGAQIPAIEEKPLATCGCRKFQLDPLGDHLNTCTAHSGAKKAHDWMVDQVADFFRTTDKVKTHQVVKRRGQPCGDIELSGYLGNASGPVSLVLDLRIAHDRVGSSTDPSLNGHLKYPNNLDQSLNDTAAKLTAFLQIQEFSLRKQTQVASSTSAARLSLPSSKAKLSWLSLRQQTYVLILT